MNIQKGGPNKPNVKKITFKPNGPQRQSHIVEKILTKKITTEFIKEL